MTYFPKAFHKANEEKKQHGLEINVSKNIRYKHTIPKQSPRNVKLVL